VLNGVLFIYTTGWKQQDGYYKKIRGNVHPRTGHEGTEGRTGIALLFF